MAARSESRVRTDTSIEITPPDGGGILAENIGGVILLSVAGRQTTSPELSYDDRLAVASVERDTMKYDFPEWLEAQTEGGDVVDHDALFAEVSSIIDIKNRYSAGREEVRSIEERIRDLQSPNLATARARSKVQEYFESELERHGRDKVASDPALQRQLLEDAEAIQPLTEGELQAELEEAVAAADAMTQSLETGLGAQLESFKVSSSEAAKKLISPIARLAQLGLVSATQGYEGLTGQLVGFGKAGGEKHMTVYVPLAANGLHIPMSYREATEFAARSRKEATNKPSIWS